MLKEIHTRFIPNKIVMVVDDGPAGKRMARHLPLLRSIGQIDGKATTYICVEYACKLPTNSISVLIKLLEGEIVPQKTPYFFMTMSLLQESLSCKF
jgi:uncharacterized protein YyaL (SSP411 family)